MTSRDVLGGVSVPDLRKLREQILDGNRGKYGSQVTGADALDSIEAELRRRGESTSVFDRRAER